MTKIFNKAEHHRHKKLTSEQKILDLENRIRKIEIRAQKQLAFTIGALRAGMTLNFNSKVWTDDKYGHTYDMWGDPLENAPEKDRKADQQLRKALNRAQRAEIEDEIEDSLR